ncbi:MAG: response regulator, partial [Lachnospiraceae bacterium]|nr:response regulator [Lachnospiraceae bacterium]
MNSIMLIRNERSFMVNALISNLTSNAYNVLEVPFQLKELEKNQAAADIIVIYADDSLMSNQGALIYLKDLCVEEDKQLIFIGSKQQIEDISTIMPSHLFAEVFERPLDMNHFIEKIDTLTDEKEQEQRKKCILIVDDDVSYLHILKEWLKDDYRVGMAKSAMQAITWLARNNVDLILLDYEMPVTNGLKVFEMLKSEQFSKDIPVMFLTGKSDKETILRVMTLKPAGYMLKDITKMQLLANLDKYFVKQRYNKLTDNKPADNKD